MKTKTTESSLLGTHRWVCVHTASINHHFGLITDRFLHRFGLAPEQIEMIDGAVLKRTRQRITYRLGFHADFRTLQTLRRRFQKHTGRKTEPPCGSK
jgi:hypothetical protein